MRILVLMNMYPPHHYGGYELLCQEVVSSFRDKSHDVMVLTSDIEVPGVTAPDTDPSVRRALRIYWADHVILRPSLREAYRVERHNHAVLSRAIEDHQPDVVSVWSMGCMSLGLLEACRRRALPLVHVMCDDWLVYAPLVDRWMQRWRRAGPLAVVAERVLDVPCRVPDFGTLGPFCFISNTTRRTAEEKAGIRFRHAPVTFSGINTDDFPVGAHAGRSGWSGRLLHVGRLDDRKGIDTAIRALARLEDGTSLDVVGRGDDRYLDELRSLAAELGVTARVTFKVAERAELAGIYAAADAFLFAPRWPEPFGLVPLEAMACSTPVVATGTGGSSEFLVDGSNCLLVAVDDDAAMAEAIRRLAGDAELRSRLVAGGLATATELTLPRWADVLEAWHIAAANQFVSGVPEERERIDQVLERVLPRS